MKPNGPNLAKCLLLGDKLDMMTASMQFVFNFLKDRNAAIEVVNKSKKNGESREEDY